MHYDLGCRWNLIWMLVAALLLGGPRSSFARVAAAPVQVDMVACVQPSERCQPTYNRFQLDVDGQDLTLVIALLNVRSGMTSSGSIIDDLAWRPQRAYGSKQDLAAIRPGAKVRIHATLRMFERMMLIQSVETVPDGFDTE